MHEETTAWRARYQELVNLVTALPISPIPQPQLRKIETEIIEIQKNHIPNKYPTYSWRRCNFQAERQAALIATDSQRCRQIRALFQKNVEKLSHEFNLAGRISGYWMKILVQKNNTITLRYWNPDDPVEKTESYEEALKREDANALLDRGINHATYKERERTFKNALNKMAENIYQAYTNNNETKQIYAIASPPPEQSEINQTREGFGTHSFIYIFFSEWINNQECRIHIKQLRTELPITAQIKMLNQYKTTYPIPKETKPEELVGYYTKLPPNIYKTEEEYIERTIYQPLVTANTESNAKEREKHYLQAVLAENDITEIHQECQELFQLYAELSLRQAPDSLKILILNTLESYAKQRAIQKSQQKHPQTNNEQIRNTILVWSQKGTFDCPIQHTNKNTTIKTTTNSNQEKKRKRVRCPTEKGGCGEIIEIEEGTTICPLCGWDNCKPNTTGKNKKNNTNTKKEKTQPRQRAQKRQEIKIVPKHEQQISQTQTPVKRLDEKKIRIQRINDEKTGPNHNIIYDPTTNEYIVFFFGIPIRTKIKPKSVVN